MVEKARHNGARQANLDIYDSRLIEFFSLLSATQIDELTADRPQVSETV
jgi:hypothetical protein